MKKIVLLVVVAMAGFACQEKAMQVTIVNNLKQEVVVSYLDTEEVSSQVSLKSGENEILKLKKQHIVAKILGPSGVVMGNTEKEVKEDGVWMIDSFEQIRIKNSLNF